MKSRTFSRKTIYLRFTNREWRMDSRGPGQAEDMLGEGREPRQCLAPADARMAILDFIKSWYRPAPSSPGTGLPVPHPLRGATRKLHETQALSRPRKRGDFGTVGVSFRQGVRRLRDPPPGTYCSVRMQAMSWSGRFAAITHLRPPFRLRWLNRSSGVSNLCLRRCSGRPASSTGQACRNSSGIEPVPGT